LPTTPDLSDLDVTRKHAKKLFEELLRSEDRAVMLVLTQVLRQHSLTLHHNNQNKRHKHYLLLNLIS
jgi:hypothetical protein